MITPSIATTLINPVPGSINAVNACIITDGTVSFPRVFLPLNRNVPMTGQ